MTIFLLLACSSSEPVVADVAPQRVFATSEVARWLGTRLGLEVTLVENPGPDEVLAMDGQVLLLNGGESWLAGVALDATVLELSAGLELFEGTGDHDHGQGSHAHGIDPTWFGDPDLVRSRGAWLAAELDRDGAALDADLAAYSVRLKGACGPLETQASHPFSYLARFCGWQGGDQPSRRVFEPGDPQLAQPHEIEVVVLDPLEAPPGGAPYDYIAMGDTNVRALLGSGSD